MNMQNYKNKLENMEQDPAGRIVLENWNRLPGWRKWKIVILVFLWSWESNLAYWWLARFSARV